MAVVMTCPTCGSTRCINPGFCALCRDAEVRKGRGEKPPSRIPHFDCAHRAYGAPQWTVETLMFGLRERGIKALEESATKRRLSEISDDQVIEVGDRLQRLRPKIARAWTAAEVETLFQARIKCPKALSMRV
jgi:hypothetical protein